MKKPCIKCGDQKPLDAFYRHPMMGDGHLNKCIDCCKADARANRDARLAYYQAYDRSRSKQPHRVNERKVRAREAPRPRPENDPLKRAARTAVSNAVRDGKLLRSPECQVCGVTTNTHGHHEDYSKPLEVLWVCNACHALIHSYWRAAERMAA